MNRLQVQLATFLIGSIFIVGTALADKSPTVLGWVEDVVILNNGMLLHAKVDTGADNSSINATGIDYFTHGDSKWVRFNVKNRAGAEIIMERPLLRVTQIKRKEGGYIERPVVNLGLCVAGQRVDAEVNLADRNHFKYLMLVGRSLMTQRFLVDPDRMHITQPTCTAV